ncbi:selenoprotein F [Amyelois transitella]|uniref:selenoprotein F n=1 Tax=Amyelois transitella TaxID=680683 RepID=UPI00298F59D1|nr:selenoprotein F [Amyelois transitella]
MLANILYTSIYVLLFIFSIPNSKSEFSTEDCASLGFIKANLLCSSCDQLKDFSLDDLVVHCKECCHNDESAPKQKKYARAILEVCTCKFPAYPQIQAFVKSDRPAKFPNLQIKYVRGLDPIIKLLDKDGIVKDTVAIEKWNTDSVEEFLNTHLEKEEDDERSYLKTNQI